MKKIYISATFNDLEEHRAAVALALRKMGYLVRCMEEYAATDQRTDARCKEDVATCAFYVGILAQRYGWIPPGQERSITEIEYRQARSQPERTRCLMFLLEDGATWPLKWVDALHDRNSAEKLAAFKKELDGESTHAFRTVQDLVHEVMAAVHTEDSKSWNQAIKGEFEKLFKNCRVTPKGAPEGLQNNEKLYLNASGKEAIIQVLQTAIQSANESKLVRIDLGQNGGWWSTRLHLLAGLLGDYTEVERLVFCQDGRHLGTCGPVETRRALAAEFPNIEKAFSGALPERRAFDPRQDIAGIVTRFSEALETQGGEPNLKVQLAAHLVRNFRGFNEDRLRYDQDRDELEQQKELLRKPHPFVAVEDQNGDVIIVNRIQFACHIAELAVSRL
jgi:Domain of unknown function (DUF4062)